MRTLVISVTLLLLGLGVGYRLGQRSRPGNPWFRPRHRPIDRLARRDRIRQREGTATILHASDRPRPHVVQAKFVRLEGTDIGRRTGRIHEPEERLR